VNNTRGSVLHRHLTKRHQQPAYSCGDAVSATGRLAYSTTRKRQGPSVQVRFSNSNWKHEASTSRRLH